MDGTQRPKLTIDLSPSGLTFLDTLCFDNIVFYALFAIDLGVDVAPSDPVDVKGRLEFRPE